MLASEMAVIRFNLKNLLVLRALATRQLVNRPNNACPFTCLKCRSLSTRPEETPPKTSGLKVKSMGIVGVETPGSEFDQDLSKWRRVYRFPFIVSVAFFCRAKLYQTGITVLMLPLSAYMWITGKWTWDDFLFLNGLCGFACSTLYLFGNVFRRLVGAVYISEDGTKTRIAHLTFFGNRQDDYYNTSEIVPLELANVSQPDLFVYVATFSSTETLLMCLKYGGITDRDGFAKIFLDDSKVIAPPELTKGLANKPKN